MSFPPGLYYLRASSATEISGLYVTGNGVDEPVTVAPHTKPFIERQVWLIEPVLNGQEGQYAISLHTKESTSGGYWYPKDGKPIPESHVLTSENAYDWFISYLDNDVPDVITIRASTPLIGVILYAGTNKDNQVIIKPVLPGAEAPYWHFTRVLFD